MTYDGRGLRFGTVAEEYDLFRPAPPREVESLFGDLHGSAVLEVGAGTGKWTRLLIELGADVTVVEPDDDMRAVLIRRSPDVHTLKGIAEALPVGDASFDAVLVSSAWHWFELPAATNEMARVLRDGGAASDAGTGAHVDAGPARADAEPVEGGGQGPPVDVVPKTPQLHAATLPAAIRLPVVALRMPTVGPQEASILTLRESDDDVV